MVNECEVGEKKVGTHHSYACENKWDRIATLGEPSLLEYLVREAMARLGVVVVIVVVIVVVVILVVLVVVVDVGVLITVNKLRPLMLKMTIFKNPTEERPLTFPMPYIRHPPLSLRGPLSPPRYITWRILLLAFSHQIPPVRIVRHDSPINPAIEGV